MARTVADVRALFDVMQGPDDGDPSAAPVPLRPRSVDQVRALPIGYFEDDERTPVTAETRAAVRTAADALERCGFQVKAFRPDGLHTAQELWWRIFGGMGAMLLGPMLAGHEDELSPILRDFSSRSATAPKLTADTLLATWVERDVVRMHVLAQMKDTPILLCPVASIPAFRHGERRWDINGHTVTYLDAWSYCEWFNLLGFPAAVVPVGRSPEGLPIGVQIVGKPWEEEVVLAVAAAVEKDSGGYVPPPTVETGHAPSLRE
jgi:Asp-tRNA(Asn)/Glu-tRNA(Gln) amidotransferase A subunit family amidase